MQTQELCLLMPEDLGFGMWAQDMANEDSVDYVNRIRATANRPLHEMVEELSQWQL